MGKTDWRSGRKRRRRMPKGWGTADHISVYIVNYYGRKPRKNGFVVMTKKATRFGPKVASKGVKIRKRKRAAGGDEKEDMIQDHEDLFNLCDSMLQDASAALEYEVLGPESVDLLKVMLQNVTILKGHVRQLKQEVDTREDIPSLLDFENLDWVWKNNPRIDYYRAHSREIDHEKYSFNDWHFPLYFSTEPLPKFDRKPFFKIHVPPGMVAGVKDCSINIQKDETASEAVAKVFKHLRRLQKKEDRKKNPLGKESNFCLKSQGSNEYMDGPQCLYNYLVIRRALREGKQVELRLCVRPTADPKIKNFPRKTLAYKKLSNEYKGTIVSEHNYQKIDESNLRKRNSGKKGELLDDSWMRRKFQLASATHRPFHCEIIGADNITKESVPMLSDSEELDLCFFVRTFVYFGTQIIEKTDRKSPVKTATFSPRWLSNMFAFDTAGKELPFYIDEIPRTARIAFFLYEYNVTEGKETPIAYVCQPMFSEEGLLLSGKLNLGMWPMDKKERKQTDKHWGWLFRSTLVANYQAQVPVASITVKFPSYIVPIAAPLFISLKAGEVNTFDVGMQVDLTQLSKDERDLKKFLEKKLSQDPSYVLQKKDRDLLWKIRHHLVKDPDMLPRVLQSVDWASPSHIREIHKLLPEWAPPKTLLAAISLLDVKYHDYKVREYAVNLLKSEFHISDEELQLYLLQLVQICKFEQYHFSPLVTFLIQRSLANPMQVGHYFFWHLKAEVIQPEFSERYGMILEEYLYHAGLHTKKLRDQNDAVKKLQKVAELVCYRKKKSMGKKDILSNYREDVRKLNDRFFSKVGTFQIPLNPRIEASTLNVEECKYMSSKMAPLWLNFTNTDQNAASKIVIFKSGDDLRQDILTLQLLKVMDMIWLKEGYDMKMKPYKVIATGVNAEGTGVGMIEVVMNSKTTADIQFEYGGAFEKTTLRTFLEENNPGKNNFEKAQNNFMYSCAGYCVATYVLGIGDRHNDNLMVSKQGHFFHIDFGHFLGNFKSKFGVKRERSAFVFTPEMAYVIGGKNYQKDKKFKEFEKLCIEVFKILRKHANDLIACFILMVSAGMPELMVEQDVQYLIDKLALDKEDKQIEKLFKNELKKALGNTFRLFDNWVHNKKHKGGKKE